MKKIIPIIIIIALVMACCQRKRALSYKQETDQLVISSSDTNEVKALEVWNALESKFKEGKSMAEKDSILMEMFHTKFYWEYSRYLEPKFDSIIWGFLQDERTFYYPFRNESPKWFVYTSEDEKVKMYSYEQNGGTAMFGRTIIQYIDNLGHLRVKELTYEPPEHGSFISPIFKTIKKTKLGYTLYGGTTVSSQEYYKASELLADTFFVGGLKNDITEGSFTVVYRQPVNGYKVKAIARFAVSDFNFISADLIFTKNGKSFKLHTQCFGDTVFCKGGVDYESENLKLFKKYRNRTIEANYHMYNKEDYLMPMYTPFFFMDLDFDGIKELVIVHQSMAVRYHDGYDVYRIVEGRPVLIDYPPYNDWRKACGFGMTDYPEFDFKKKTISCSYPEGELTWTGRNVYGVSKMQKDTVIVNGKKHYFNHMELIKEEKY